MSGFKTKVGGASVTVGPDGRIKLVPAKRRKSVSAHIQARKSKRVKVVRRV